MSDENVESSVKRRLSLRGGAGSPEKKPRSDMRAESKELDYRNPNPERYGYDKARTDIKPSIYINNAMDIDMSSSRLPSSASSSRFPFAPPTGYSSPPESTEGGRPRSQRSTSRDSHSTPLLANPRPMAPTWATSAPNDNDGNAYSSSSSRSSHRQQPYHQLSTSAPSRVASPPDFNLSNGQPLVNPPLKTQAAFVGKLYAMLEDEDIARTGLIQWSQDGSIFTCPNPTEFAK